MNNKIYCRTSSKYIYFYQVLSESSGLHIGSILIDRRKEKVVNRKMSYVKPEDVNKFYTRNRPLKELKNGVDLIAKLLLNNYYL